MLSRLSKLNFLVCLPSLILGWNPHTSLFLPNSTLAAGCQVSWPVCPLCKDTLFTWHRMFRPFFRSASLLTLDTTLIFKMPIVKFGVKSTHKVSWSSAVRQRFMWSWVDKEEIKLIRYPPWSTWHRRQTPWMHKQHCLLEVKSFLVNWWQDSNHMLLQISVTECNFILTQSEQVALAGASSTTSNATT